MENTIQAPTVGSQFTTQKSAVTGTVTEVKENKNGTLRIKLDVNGQDRWTTVKQFQLWGLPKMSDPYAKIISYLLKNGVPNGTRYVSSCK